MLSLLMSAGQPWTDQMEGRVVGYWTSVKQKLECVVNKEVGESCFRLGSKGVHLLDLIRFLKTRKLMQRRIVSSLTDSSFHG